MVFGQIVCQIWVLVSFCCRLEDLGNKPFVGSFIKQKPNSPFFSSLSYLNTQTPDKPKTPTTHLSLSCASSPLQSVGIFFPLLVGACSPLVGAVCSSLSLSSLETLSLVALFVRDFAAALDAAIRWCFATTARCRAAAGCGRGAVKVGFSLPCSRCRCCSAAAVDLRCCCRHLGVGGTPSTEGTNPSYELLRLLSIINLISSFGVKLSI